MHIDIVFSIIAKMAISPYFRVSKFHVTEVQRLNSNASLASIGNMLFYTKLQAPPASGLRKASDN